MRPDVKWRRPPPYFGSLDFGSTAAEDPPLSRDTPVLLFDGHDGTRSDECGVDIANVLFDDHADRSVDEDYLSPYNVGFGVLVFRVRFPTPLCFG